MKDRAVERTREREKEKEGKGNRVKKRVQRFSSHRFSAGARDSGPGLTLT